MSSNWLLLREFYLAHLNKKCTFKKTFLSKPLDVIFPSKKRFQRHPEQVILMEHDEAFNAK
jgi:hypothetical protein